MFKNEWIVWFDHEPWSEYMDTTCTDDAGNEYPCVTIDKLEPFTHYEVRTVTHLEYHNQHTDDVGPTVAMYT